MDSIEINRLPSCFGDLRLRGKSLTAKATSARLGLPLLRLDIGSLMGRYVGDSEGNMRRALKLAETVSPCVLWVDELEKAFTGIGGGSTSAGSEITSRLFGYFLTWMQEKTKSVFVLTTANDVSALPPELLRKGRFDEIFYVDFPDEDERVAILKVHLKKRKKDGPRIDVKQLARQTEGFSGADLEGVVKDAIEDAFLEGEAELDTGHLHRSMEKNKSHAMMMKDRAEENSRRWGSGTPLIKADAGGRHTRTEYESTQTFHPPQDNRNSEHVLKIEETSTIRRPACAIESCDLPHPTIRDWRNLDGCQEGCLQSIVECIWPSQNGT